MTRNLAAASLVALLSFGGRALAQKQLDGVDLTGDEPKKDEPKKDEPDVAAPPSKPVRTATDAAPAVAKKPSDNVAVERDKIGRAHV